MKRRELFAKALRGCEEFRGKYPDDQAIVSIIKQLSYLIELEKGDRDDRDRLKDIIIGVLTVREIEALDGALADVLYEVAEEVRRMETPSAAKKEQQVE